jgi:protein-tyrosine-phosphatase
MNENAPLLLFVCMGNICRSPIAEAIAVDAARNAGIDVRVSSAGISALTGHMAHDHARAVVRALGLDLDGHRARQLTRELVHEAALVVTATRRQCADLRHFFPNDPAKIVSFDEVTGLGELVDPFGDGPEAFSKIAGTLAKGMPSILDALQPRT